MLPPAPRCALILAGGRSVRMGQPKATLQWGASTMLEHVAAVLSASCERIVVVGHAELQLPELGANSVRIDDPATLDDQGPLAGTQCGLTHLAATRPANTLVYLAAVDKPLLTPAHVDFIFTQLEDPSIDAVLPVQQGRPRAVLQPLAGAVRLGPAERTARSLLNQGERALKRLFTAMPHHQLDANALPSRDVLRDCNTPAEYAAARGRPTPDPT